MSKTSVPGARRTGAGPERARRSRRPHALLALIALICASVALLVGTAGAAAPGDPVVVREDDVSGCMGVRTTPGSENTDKRLVGGSLVPGGTASFEISYPVDEKDVGRQTFVIADCVFIDGEPVVRYSVSFVPNRESFVLSFTLDIPADAPIGGEYCNYAKTTAAPSESQASNRKAGPACFVIGGDLRVLKVDEAGASLAGAEFSVSCDPTTSLLPVIIEGAERTSFSGVVDDGTITIAGPRGTGCTITETAAPPGYRLADPRTVVAVIGVDGPEIGVVNMRQTGSLVLTKSTVGGTGTFHFTVDCDGREFDRTVSIAGSGSETAAGIPTGTRCTVTETADPLFSSVVVPADGTVTIAAGDNTVAFTNTARPPSVQIAKTAAAGSVEAGTPIGFSVTVGNAGPGLALGVVVSDPLPAGTGVDWSIDPAYGGPGTCSIAGAAPAQVLTCSLGDMAPGATATVGVTSPTAAGTSGTFVNTAVARADNHAEVRSTASVVVVPPAPALPLVPLVPPLAPAPLAPAPVAPAPLAPAPVAPAEVLGVQFAAPAAPAAPQAPATAVQAAAAERPAELPRTGFGVLPLVGTGLGLVGLGSIAIRAGRRRTTGTAG